MEPQDFLKIKGRHLAATAKVERGDEAAAKARDAAEKRARRDIGDLVAEVERLEANFEEAIAIIDYLINHHVRIVPRETADALRYAKERIRGLR